MRKISIHLLLLLILLTLGNDLAFAQILNNNSVYRITSFYANRSLGVSNSSIAQNADVVTYTSSGSNSQSWKAKYDSESGSYLFTNLGSDRNIYFFSLVEGVAAKQGLSFLPAANKWIIEAVNNPSYPNCYYIYNSTLTSGGKRLYLEVPPADPISNSEGVAARGWTDSQDGTVEPRRLWKFVEVPEKQNAPTDETVANTFNSFKTKYYKKAVYGYVLGAPGFWNVAEMMEILLDAFETSGHIEYKEMFYNVYENFIRTQGNRNGDWMSNPYNDDLAWIVIACTRAYVMFNDSRFITIAKSHFDRMYGRALLSHGGLRWKEGNGDGSNSCINGPAQVAAMYIAKATGDNTYYIKAKRIYDYQYRVLYDPNSGRVYDSALGDNVTNNWASTYNQGTFIGANLLLYEYFKDPKYLSTALKVANYTKNTMYNNAVLNNEHGRDLDGFKGILMRYMRKLIVDHNQTSFIPWLHLNAKVAYNNRNSEGIIGTLWGTKSAEGSHDVFAASTAVSLMVNTPLSLSVTKKPFEIIQAEDFDYVKGAIAEDCPDGTENLGDIQDNEYTGYMNVDFGTRYSDRVEFRLSSGDVGGSIEVRLGDPNGQLLGTAIVPVGAGWQDYIDVSCEIIPVSGLQNIFLVYKGEGYVVNLNWFKFVDTTMNLHKTEISKLTIVPNVVKRGEKIHFLSKESGLVKIFNLAGSKIFEVNLHESNSIPSSNLYSGTYIMTIENGHEKKQAMFIVK